MKLPIIIDHPGVHIAEELEARGWFQADLAFYLEVNDSLVSMLIQGKRDVNTILAIKLASVFDTSAEFFLNLQNIYDTALAKSSEREEFDRRTQLKKSYPVREMIKRGWINCENPIDTELTAFFSVGRTEEIGSALPHAAKRTGDNISITQKVWLHQVRRLAQEMLVSSYTKRKLNGALAEMNALRTSPQDVSRVPRLLADAGVRFVVVEGLPGGKIDGVCTWLDGTSPVVGLSTRWDRIDNFWFVLRHELEHVLQGDGRDDLMAPMVDTEKELDMLSTSIAEEEIVANKAAADFCVPQEAMNRFYARKNPYFSRASVLAFASIHQVHPGIVVGQLHRRMDRHDYLREMQVKVRSFVVSTALSDGWGNVAPVN